MIHIFTIHPEDHWVDIQLKQFEKYIKEPYKVYTRLGQNNDQHAKKFAVCLDGKDHQCKSFGKVVDKVRSSIKPEDIVIRMDSDAFPISDDFITVISEKLKDKSMVAMEEPEHELNLKIMPHPAFMAFSGGTFIGEGLDKYLSVMSIQYSNWWGKVMNWVNTKNRTYYPLQRTNKVNLHRLYYGIYEDIVYHHWAGSRKMVTRADRRKASKTGEKLEDIINSNHETSKLVLEYLQDQDQIDKLIEFLAGEDSSELKIGDFRI